MKRILIIVAAVLAVTSMGATAAMGKDHGPAGKVFVCKYVGTPGADERLQTGQNPISVSINAIKDYAGVGSYFNDAQGRSFVLAEDVGQPEPDVSECPGYVPPTPTCEETNTCPTEEHNPAVTVTVECVEGINELSYLIDADGAVTVQYLSEDGTMWIPADVPVTHQAVSGGTSASLTFRFVFEDESVVQVTAGSDLSECGTDVTPPGSGGTPPPPSVVPAATKAQNSGSLPYTL